MSYCTLSVSEVCTFFRAQYGEICFTRRRTTIEASLNAISRADVRVMEMQDRRTRNGMASSDLWYVVLLVGLHSRIISDLHQGWQEPRQDHSSSASNSSQPLSPLSLVRASSAAQQRRPLPYDTLRYEILRRILNDEAPPLTT
jgi:hypothetical protein